MPLSLATELLASIDVLPEIAAGVGESVRRKFAAEALAGEAALYSGEAAVQEAAPAWDAILREDGTATAFQSLAVARAATAAHLTQGHIPHVVVVQDGAEPLVILPLASTRMAGARVLRFLGDPMVQYGDVIASPRATDAHVACALDSARQIGSDAALFRKVRADARIAPLLARLAPASCTDDAPYVDLRREDGLSPRDRRELRRFRRRLGDIGELTFDVVRGADAVPLVRAALDLKREWLVARGLSSAVVGDPAWEGALVALCVAPQSPLMCAKLEAGGKLAAIELALVEGGRWHAYLGATDPALAKSGPGQVQMADTIAWCREQGLAAYDLLAPADAFKRAIANQSVAVCDFAVPLNAGGRIATRAYHWAPTAKWLLGKMPPMLRRLAAVPLRAIR
jgi:CelD/BcsL family acetyltransferase involved in cellulose biosynthesis